MQAPANSGPGNAISLFISRSNLMRLAMERASTHLHGSWDHVRQRIRLHLLSALAGLINRLESLYTGVEVAGLPQYRRHSRPTLDRHSRWVRR